jgi:PKD repeat protein
MNMDVTTGIQARFANALRSSLVVVAAITLAACGGGGDTPSTAGPGATQGALNTSLSATPTAMSDPNGPAPLAVTFMAMEPKGSIASYEWDFKDNSPVKSGQSVEHTFMTPGSYSVTLTVRDAKGDFNRASVMVSVADGGTCAQIPADFSTFVWPAMKDTCTACHATGKVAGGTALVFPTGGTELQSYNALRNYAKMSSDTLLAKVIGGMSHGGGAPFQNAQSVQYKALADLVPVMKQACTSGSGSAPVAGQFWNGVSYASDTTVLSKAAVLFAGRNPTAAETQAVMNGGAPVLRETIRSYMTGPAFDRFLEEMGDTWFLTRGVVVFGNNMGLNATDLPSAANVINNQNLTGTNVRNRFQAAMQREPVELMKYIVKNDKPWTDMIAGNYTVVNPLVAQFLAARVTGTFTGGDPLTTVATDTEYLPAVLPNQRLAGDREHAGVVSTHAWLQRFPTTPTNRNRHRVYIMAKQFLATDVAALAARPIDDSGSFKIPTMENPACAACHTTIDPIAASWQNWNEANRYLPNRDAMGKDHALPNSYRANNYPKDKDNQAYYKVGDNWFRDQHAPGYGTTPMPGGVTGNNTALQWMGQQVAADSRFAMGAVHFAYKAVFNREPMKAPLDQTSPTYAYLVSAYNAQVEEFKAIAGRFATNRGNGVYNMKDLMVDLVTSPLFKAEKVTGLSAGRMVELQEVGAQALLNPAALNRKLLALTGVAWNQFNNPYAGQALNYGNFDGGLNRMMRANEYTMVQTMIADRMMSELSCNIVMTDFNKPTANRILFGNIALTDTPANAAGETAIQQKIAFLHRHLLHEEVAPSDAEAQRTYALFRAVWADRATAPARPTTCAYNNNNDPNYTGRAWAAVIAYMIGDSKFLVY